MHSSADGEGLLWFGVNVESAGEALLSAHHHTVHGRQGMDTEMTTLHSWSLQASQQAQEQDLSRLPGYPMGAYHSRLTQPLHGAFQLSWLLCQWHPSPPLQLAQPLLCATTLDSVTLNFLRCFLRTPSRIRVCEVHLSVFSHLPFDYQRELISISISVGTAGSRTSCMNFLESIQLPESSHQTSSKCHPWLASFRNRLFLCV